MAVTQNTYTGDNSTVLYNFTFPYLTQTDVKVKLDGVTQATTAYSFANATTIQMNSAPGSGVKVIIYRDTDNDNKKATFYPGSAIKAEDLNNNIDQILYVAQEVDNNAMSSLGDTPMQGDMEFGQGMGIVFEGATTDNFETRLAVADPTADRTITLPNVTGTVITTGDTGTVTSAMITDATIVNADINGSAAIAQSKLNIANATTSAAGYQSAADKTKLDGIETAATADQTNAEIRAAVEAASDSNVFTDADHTKLNNIETAATADQTAAEIRTLVGDASNSNVFTDSDNTKLAGIETAATADQTASEIKALIASSPLDASHLAADSVTTSELADAELTTLAGMQSGTASILADSTALTSTTTELNQLDGKTLGETTLTTNSNTAIPTSKAVNDRIVTVTNALGGFVAIADKDNFPTSHPDPSENAGTVVSISNAVGISVNSSGVGSLATRAGGSDAVVINGFPSALRGGATVGSATNANPYVLPANVGLQVQTTSTAHTYDYHKYLINEEDANKLSGDIQDFQERYRVSSSAPTSSLNDGDLYFDTTQNKMKVYNLSSTSWDDVATPGNFFISTLSPAFDGSTTQFTITNAPNSAQQIILSLNGVVQKPGTAFTLSGSTVTFASAPVSGSDYFAVVMGSAVNIGTPSNNTVSTAIIQNLAVTGDKIATNLDLADNKKIRFGTGNDLQLYHDGTNSHLNNTTGYLVVGTDSYALKSQNLNEFYIKALKDGAVELYYDNSKKFETYSTGSIAYENLFCNAHVQLYDNYELRVGSGSDLKIYHDGTDSIIKAAGSATPIKIQGHSSNASTVHISARADKETIKCLNNTNAPYVELYYDNSKSFETTSTGAKVNGAKLEVINTAGAGDSQLYLEAGEGGTAFIQFIADNGDDNTDKSRILQGDGTNLKIQNYDSGSWLTRFETTSTGCLLGDSVKLQFGAGPDLNIYSDGTNSFIQCPDTGNNLTIESDQHLYIKVGDSEDAIKCVNGGAVELYYNGTKQVETTANGLTIHDYELKVQAPAGSSAQLYLYGDNGNDNNDLWYMSAGNGVFNLNYYVGSGTWEKSIECNSDGSVSLYHNNAKKFETQLGGAKVSGKLEVDSVTNQHNTELHVTVNEDVHALNIIHGGVAVNGNPTRTMVEWRNFNNEAIAEITSNSSTITYGTGSDYRMKENQVGISDGITRIKQLKPYRFNWKSEYGGGDKVDGFFAHEAATVVPESVLGVKDAVDSDGNIIRQQIDQAKLIPLLTAALQEAITKVETLETKVAALEAK